MIKTKNKEPIALYFCIFILFVTSMGLWIGWNGRGDYIYAVIGVFMFLFVRTNHVKLEYSKRNVISLIVVILCFTYIRINEKSLGLRVPFIFYLPVSLLILLNEEDKIKCIPHIVRWFSYLLIPSIIVYLLYQTVGLPSLGEIQVSGNVDQPYEYTHRQNYIFYCYSDFGNYAIRFNGPFIEPGHLGMMSSFLLLASGYNFKKIETWIIILGILFTLSLSGYMLAFFGYLFYQFGNGRINVKFIIGVFFFVLIVLYVAFTYNDGDNLLFELIVSRLEPDEEKGFAGNNRVFGEIDLYFATMFTDTRLLLFGYDVETMQYLSASGSRGTGLVMEIVRHGIVGAVLSILFYFVYAFNGSRGKMTFAFLAYVLMLYWQRTYPFWFAWIICYVYGLTCYENVLTGKYKVHPTFRVIMLYYRRRKLLVILVYLNNHKQMYKYEQQFSISCLGAIHP